MTKTEIILETVKYYNKHNRGIEPKHRNCVYYSPENKNMCAVGRCLTDATVFDDFIRANSSYGGSSISELKCELDEFLKPEYRGHSNEFWEDIQRFHDNYDCWSKKLLFKGNKLNKEGKNRLNALLDKYKNQ